MGPIYAGQIGCIRVAHDTEKINGMDRICWDYYTTQDRAAEGFHIGIVPANHYIAVQDAQVRFIDRIDGLPAWSAAEGLEEEVPTLRTL